MIGNVPRRVDAGSEANRQRASQARQQQAVLAWRALAVLQADTRPSAHRDRWIRGLQHRISNPHGALAELGQTMMPPMTKHAYAALLRRALRGGGISVGAVSADGEGVQRD